MSNKYEDEKAEDIYNVVKKPDYDYEPETKRQLTVWCSPDDEPPTKVLKSRSACYCLFLLDNWSYPPYSPDLSPCDFFSK